MLGHKMNANTKKLKKSYREFVQLCGFRPELIDRQLYFYMGYVVPLSFREWVKSVAPTAAYSPEVNNISYHWRVRKGLEKA